MATNSIERLLSENNNKLKQGFHNLCCKLDTHIFEGCLECQNSFKYLISASGLGFDIPFEGHLGDGWIEKGCVNSNTTDDLKDFYFIDQNGVKSDLFALLGASIGVLPYTPPSPTSGGDFSVYIHFITQLGLHVILEIRYTYDSINNNWLISQLLTSNSTTSQVGAASNEVLYNVKIKKIQYTNGSGTITYINPLTGNTLSLNSGESLALNCNETLK